MTPATFRALRETCGYTQGDVAEAVGVALRTVKRWESYDGEPPADVAEWVLERVEDHERAVEAMVEVAEDARDRTGVSEVAVSYYREQMHYVVDGRDDGPFGVANARARDAAAILRDEGFEVRFVYPEGA